MKAASGGGAPNGNAPRLMRMMEHLEHANQNNVPDCPYVLHLRVNGACCVKISLVQCLFSHTWIVCTAGPQNGQNECVVLEFGLLGLFCRNGSE